MKNHVSNLVNAFEEQILMAEEIKKQREENDGQAEYEASLEREKVTITTRVDSLQASYLDQLAEKCNLSRSGLVKELATSALMDVMEEMGLTEEFFNNALKKESANV